MELEVGALTGAPYGENNADRRAQRNGYRDRDWRTRSNRASPSSEPAAIFPAFSNRRLISTF